MEIFIPWLIFSIVVGVIGSSRKIGFAGAFILSLLLSPLIGFIITIFSKNIKEEKYKKELLKTQKQQQEKLSNLNDTVQKNNLSDELWKLREMLKDETLTEDEFQVAKGKLLNGLSNDDTKKHITESNEKETIEQNNTNNNTKELESEETVVKNNSITKYLKFKYFLISTLFVLLIVAFVKNKIESDHPSNTEKTNTTISKASPKPSNTIISNTNIVGNWIPSPNTGYTIIEEIRINKIDDSHYSCVLVLLDNSRTTENLVLNSNNEYHTNNSYGEYYKLLGDRLGTYDKDGLIETYYKSN